MRRASSPYWLDYQDEEVGLTFLGIMAPLIDAVKEALVTPNKHGGDRSGYRREPIARLEAVLAEITADGRVRQIAQEVQDSFGPVLKGFIASLIASDRG